MQGAGCRLICRHLFKEGKNMKGVKIKQFDSYDCGAACLCSVASWYGAQFPLSEVRRACGCTSEGITIKGIIDGAATLGFTAKGYKAENITADTLTYIVAPVIAHTRQENGYLHFIVIYRVSKKYLTIMDPACGEFLKISKDEFVKKWTGYIITLIPAAKIESGNIRADKTRRLLKILTFHKKEILLALYGSIILTLIGICNSMFLRRLIDEVIPSGNLPALILISAVILILIPIQLFIGYSQNLYLLRNGIKIDTELIMSYLGKLFRLPVNFFKEYGSGDLESRISDTYKIRTFISEGVVSLFVSASTVLVVLIIMFSLYWRVALCVLAFIPLYVAVYFAADRINRKYSRELAISSAEFENDIIDAINGAETIKHFGAERIAANKYNKSYSILMEKSYKAGKYGAVCGTAGSGVSLLLLACIIVIGGFYVCGGEISIGELVAFYTLSTMLVAPVSNLININSIANEAVTASERLFEIIELKDEESTGISTDTDKKHVISMAENCLSKAKELTLNKVTFGYPGRETLLKDLSRCFRFGEITAIQGLNGSGKSTVASLIMRDIQPNRGTLEIDGTGISNFPIEMWRRSVSIAPQRGHVFDATLLDNITAGAETTDYENFKKIYSMVGLDEFCTKHPMGPLTVLGENGSSISGGEMQKIMIARALYRNPKIMIFDEATSFMDEFSENRILDLMVDLKRQGKCIIFITHKSSNMRVADKIIRL